MYFEKPGKENTKETLQAAVRTAKERGISHLVIASTGGETPQLLEDTEGLNVVIVTTATGSKIPNENRVSAKRRAEWLAKGYQVCTAAHALSGAERGISSVFHGVYPVEIIAAALRMFGQGTKVCVEVATMAADAGMIPSGEPVIVVGGTGQGADTALILKAANSCRILDTKIEEIICKPLL